MTEHKRFLSESPEVAPDQSLVQGYLSVIKVGVDQI